MPLNCIEIGIRQNLLYPFLFMLCINILRTIRVFFLQITGNEKLNSFFSLLTFLSNIFFSLMLLYLENKANKTNRNTKIVGIYAIEEGNNEDLTRLDSDSKIFFLIFLDAYFEFISIIRKIYLLAAKPEKTNALPLDIRIRSREIIFASMICYFTIGTQLKRHHIVSLIIILICVISLYIFEITSQFMLQYYDSIFKFLQLQALKIFINTCRVFSDVIEKYLFEFNYFSPFKLLFLKGIMQTVFMAVFYLVNDTEGEFSSLFFSHNLSYIVLSIILLLLYFLISGFSSIYKLLTVKMYSPMTRTLSDTALDILYFIYYSIKDEDEYKKFNTPYFWANFFGFLLMLFFNLVYNEILVLNFGEMGRNTHKEISKRASNIKLINSRNESNSINSESIGSDD